MLRRGLGHSPVVTIRDTSRIKLDTPSTLYSMTAVDEVSALTQSIGEYAVQSIGTKHLVELSVVLSPVDWTARIAVALADNSEKEQSRALDKLFEVQELFFDDVSMTFAFGADGDLPVAQTLGSRQYSYA